MSGKFGAYEILHELKAGGMGAVLLGRRRGPGAFEQLVAIKTIRSEYASSPAVRAMFLDEAAIVARINHPVIATVHDFGDQDGTLYMVMEYVAGTSFRSLSDRILPPSIAARAIAEACRGLHAAHEVRDTAGALMGVVHRDISPDNLMLGFDGHIKVIDFGIALVKNRQSPVTEFGTVKGKPPYMSPEQVKNETIDRRSDVFSLGVVLHELLTGAPLFDGDSIYAIARAVEHQELRAPSLVRGEPLPAGLDAAVMRALTRDPAKRTPSAAALAEELERVITNAGDETLEAWAERELAAPREAHRRWLAGVVLGTEAPHPMGRATGARTAVGPVQRTPKPAVALAAAAADGGAGAAVVGGAAARGADAAGAGGAGAGAAGAGGADAAGVGAGDAGAGGVGAGGAGAAVVGGGAGARGGAGAVERRVSTIDDVELDRVPRRSLVPVAGVLLMLGAAIVVIVMMRRSATDAGQGSPADAAVVAVSPDAPDAPVLASPDAAVDAAPIAVLDAGAPRDAGVVVVRRDAGPPRDASVAVARIDAARPAMIDAAPVARGAGKVSFRARRGAYVNVTLDGQSLGPTPIFNHEVSAGSHTVEMRDPVGNLVHKATFVVDDGELENITQP